MGTVAANDKYSGVVQVNLVASRFLPWAIAMAALATGVLVLATPLPLEAHLLAATAVACLAIDAVRRAHPARTLATGIDGAIALDEAQGTVRDGSFVAPWLTIVRWRRTGARFDRTLLLLPDMLGKEDFRQLRVILKSAMPREP